MKQFKTMGYSEMILIILCFSSTTGFLETNRRTMKLDNVIQINDINDKRSFESLGGRFRENLPERRDVRRYIKFSENERELTRTDRFSRQARDRRLPELSAAGKHIRLTQQENNFYHNGYEYNNELNTNKHILDVRKVREQRTVARNNNLDENNSKLQQRTIKSDVKNNDYRQSFDSNINSQERNFDRRIISRQNKGNKIARQQTVRFNSETSPQLENDKQRRFISTEQNKINLFRTPESIRRNSVQIKAEIRKIPEKIEQRSKTLSAPRVLQQRRSLAPRQYFLSRDNSLEFNFNGLEKGRVGDNNFNRRNTRFVNNRSWRLEMPRTVSRRSVNRRYSRHLNEMSDSRIFDKNLDLSREYRRNQKYDIHSNSRRFIEAQRLIDSINTNSRLNRELPEKNVIKQSRSEIRTDNTLNNRRVQRSNLHYPPEKITFSRRSTALDKFNINRLLENRKEINQNVYKPLLDRQLIVSSISHHENVNNFSELKSSILMNALKVILISILVAQIAAKTQKNKNNWISQWTNFVAATKEKVL